MNYLLDTHTFLWLLTDTRKLPALVITAIRKPDAVVGISIVSLWEISIKYGLGKLQLKNVVPEELPQLAIESGLGMVTLDPQDAASAYQLERLGNKDPFDRMLVWQAMRQGYTLISKDKELQAYKRLGLKLLW